MRKLLFTAANEMQGFNVQVWNQDWPGNNNKVMCAYLCMAYLNMREELQLADAQDVTP